MGLIMGVKVKRRENTYIMINIKGDLTVIEMVRVSVGKAHHLLLKS